MRTLALLALLLLAPARSAPAAPDQPTGKVRFALVGSIETLDPPRASSEAARTCVANLFDQLFQYAHLDRPYALEPCLAEALPVVSEDGRTQTIRLKTGVRFLDDPCFADGRGREVTAHDVAFCLRRLMDARIDSPGRWMFERRIAGLDAFTAATREATPDTACWRYEPAEGFPEVAGIEVVDAHTLRIRLLEAMPELAWLLASPWTSIYPPEAVRRYGADLGRHAVSTGPFRVAVFLANRKLLLQANPDYRSERYPPAGTAHDAAAGLLEDAGKPLPRSALVEVTAYADPLTAWSAFLGAEVDVAEIPRDALNAAVDVSAERLLPYLAERGVRLHRDPRLEIFYDAFNAEDPVLGRPAGERGLALRRAISLVVDDAWALERLYTNHAERVRGPLLPEMRGYDPAFRNPWQSRADETREEVLALARETLAEAGMPEGRGVPVLRMHILDDAMSRRVFEIQRDQLAEIGLRLEAVPVAWPLLQEVLRQKQAQCWTSSWYADYPDALNFLQLFYGPNGPEPNNANYANQEFDGLYRDARRLAPGRDRDDLVRWMQRIVTDDCAWRFRFRRVRWAASQGWLYGYRHNDVVPKHFRFCRVDEAARLAAERASAKPPGPDPKDR